MILNRIGALGSMATHHVVPVAIVSAIALVVLSILRVRLRRGLCQIPGPFLASISSLDRIRTAASGKQHDIHQRYHAKYGPMVRVGPNHISLSNCNLIPRIYNITTDFYKSDFYSLFDVCAANGEVTPTVFSVRNEAYHKALKRPVAAAYSTSTMRDFEPLVDSCIALLERKLAENQDQHTDLGRWVHWFAFDVISEITFSNRLGFMEEERDVAGIIGAIEGRLAYNCVVGEVPWLNKYLLGNATVARIASACSRTVRRLNSAHYIVDFAAHQLGRYEGQKGAFEDKSRDMLARFKMNREGDSVMTHGELLSHASSNM
jgi:Cytochrome P450